MTTYDGRLVYSNGSQGANSFSKDMEGLHRAFAKDMSKVHRRVQRNEGKWTDLADNIVDTMIAGGPGLAADMVWGLEYAKEDCFLFMDTVLTVMERHGVAFGKPAGPGALSPDDFANQARSHVGQMYGDLLERAKDQNRRRGS